MVVLQLQAAWGGDLLIHPPPLSPSPGLRTAAAGAGAASLGCHSALRTRSSWRDGARAGGVPEVGMLRNLGGGHLIGKLVDVVLVQRSCVGVRGSKQLSVPNSCSSADQ